ncbi:hypothetical protein M2146_002525 [Lachnospiraceae bacterium PF1-22]
MGDKIMLKILRKKGTFAFITNHAVRTGIIPVIQFSLKDPWLLPRREPCYLDNGKKHLALIGWLFFYFGAYIPNQNNEKRLLDAFSRSKDVVAIYVNHRAFIVEIKSVLDDSVYTHNEKAFDLISEGVCEDFMILDSAEVAGMKHTLADFKKIYDLKREDSVNPIAE